MCLAVYMWGEIIAPPAPALCSASLLNVNSLCRWCSLQYSQPDLMQHTLKTILTLYKDDMMSYGILLQSALVSRMYKTAWLFTTCGTHKSSETFYLANTHN